MNQPLIIIVPGLNGPAWSWPFSLLVKLYCWYFGLTGAGNDWSQFKEYLEHLEYSVLLMQPLRWFSKKEIAAEGKKLAERVDAADRAAVLVGYSLGTSVIESAVAQCARPDRVVKVLSIASPHKTKALVLPRSIEVVNVYSDADTYLDFSNRMLYLGGYKELERARNIKLDNLTHSDFTSPAHYDFYTGLLR